MSQLTKAEKILNDPLSETSRKARKFLLGGSLIGLMIYYSNLIPTKISALGFEFNEVNQTGFITVLSLVILFYLMTFIIYASSDFLKWRISIIETSKSKIQEHIRNNKGFFLPNSPEMEVHKVEQVFFEKYKQLYGSSTIISYIRILIDIIFPIILSLFIAIKLLIK
ncbi:MAG TPA: hypothetical protein DDX39_08365 [Bacteroidales bacterium]|nr:MAG: hypothetical protein A2W98_09850 [Bacteroidetes bacterium GWF2_33_38]OFY90932.1 MAG: hypothetical protein A2236_09820 [Bacteroidetes bacterium RIFOXYA2_FULL_33_7]HBF88640.1 hypothetical protein [Bacteroidales bacterium]